MKIEPAILIARCSSMGQQTCPKLADFITLFFAQSLNVKIQRYRKMIDLIVYSPTVRSYSAADVYAIFTI